MSRWARSLQIVSMSWALALGGGLATPALAQGSAQASSTLERGSEGSAVRSLQQRLSQLGYSLAVDGDFGPATEAAVRAFQRDQGIGVDGRVGPQTRARLASPQGGGGGSGLVPALGGSGAAGGPAGGGASGGSGIVRPEAGDSPAEVRRASRAWANAAKAAGRSTLVVAFEGLASYSQSYANRLYAYQDKRRAGTKASAPRAPSLKSYVAKYLIAPVLKRGGPDVLFLGENSERANKSVALDAVLAWHAVHGAQLDLVIVGHSFGGMAALRLAKKLNARGIAVNHLLTLDARTLPNLYSQFVTPPNVRDHHNYFQRSLWFPGYPIDGAQDHRLSGVRHTRMPKKTVVRERFRTMLGG